jgi:putative flavoprotein involved in K+ transport
VAPLVLRPLFRLVFHRVLTTDTPIGRKMRQKHLAGGDPLIRVKPKDLAAIGVVRVPRTVGALNGRPVLEDGRVLEVANVIWCTGYYPDFSWIDLPVFGEREEPLHRRGIVVKEPGLYFVGLKFLYAASSTMIQGVSRDAEYVVQDIAARARRDRSVSGPREQHAGATTARPRLPSG